MERLSWCDSVLICKKDSKAIPLTMKFQILSRQFMVKRSYEVQVTSYELTSWSLKARIKLQKCEFKSTSYEFKSTNYLFKSTSYEFKSTSYEFKSTSYEFKSTTARITKSMKTQVYGLKSFSFPKIISSNCSAIHEATRTFGFTFPLHHDYSFSRRLTE